MLSRRAFMLSAAAASTALPTLARSQPAIPEVDERGKTRLKGVEAETLAVVFEPHAVDALHERVDAAACFPWRTREPPREEHVVLGFEALQLDFEHLNFSFGVGGGFRHGRHSVTRPKCSL